MRYVVRIMGPVLTAVRKCRISSPPFTTRQAQAPHSGYSLNDSSKGKTLRPALAEKCNNHRDRCSPSGWSGPLCMALHCSSLTYLRAPLGNFKPPRASSLRLRPSPRTMNPQDWNPTCGGNPPLIYIYIYIYICIYIYIYAYILLLLLLLLSLLLHYIT